MGSGMLIVYQELLPRVLLLFATRLLLVNIVPWMAASVQLQNVNPFVFTCTNVTTHATVLTVVIFVNIFIRFILSYKSNSHKKQAGPTENEYTTDDFEESQNDNEDVKPMSVVYAE